MEKGVRDGNISSKRMRAYACGDDAREHASAKYAEMNLVLTQESTTTAGVDSSSKYSILRRPKRSLGGLRALKRASTCNSTVRGMQAT